MYLAHVRYCQMSGWIDEAYSTCTGVGGLSALLFHGRTQALHSVSGLAGRKCLDHPSRDSSWRALQAETQNYSWNSATLWGLSGDLLERSQPRKQGHLSCRGREWGSHEVVAILPGTYLTLSCCASVPVAQFYHLFLLLPAFAESLLRAQRVGDLGDPELNQRPLSSSWSTGEFHKVTRPTKAIIKQQRNNATAIEEDIRSSNILCPSPLPQLLSLKIKCCILVLQRHFMIWVPHITPGYHSSAPLYSPVPLFPLKIVCFPTCPPLPTPWNPS